MERSTKKDIESIFPLNLAQQGLLFHSLSSSKDQGFLNVQCDIEGPIEILKFEEAWNSIVARHAVLRTTVHWKNLEKPLQIVHKKKNINFITLDWSNLVSLHQEENWTKLLSENSAKEIDFSKGVLLDVKLVKLNDNRYRLLWSNHHLLIDGWSSNIILKELITSYEDLINVNEVGFEKLPSYKSYLRWLGQQNKDLAKEFWTGYFKEFTGNKTFEENKGANQDRYLNLQLKFNSVETNTLKQYAKAHKVSLNTILQSVWSLTLCRFFNTEDSVHGTTVSGRTSDFPNIENLTGMFSKVHPVRNTFGDSGDILSRWFSENQNRQLAAKAFEYLELDTIIENVDSSVDKLFDSLLIFENYPVVAATQTSISISNFKSGITTTYPVSIVLIPGDALNVKLIISKSVIEYETVAKWLLDNFVKLVLLISSKQIINFSDVSTKIPTYQKKQISIENKEVAYVETDLVLPRNEIETKIAKVWQDSFGIKQIGVHQDFFKLGGKSLLAVKLFSALNSAMGSKLYPTTLLAHPTIAALANIFTKEDKVESYSYLVPIKNKGNKRPVFCIHGGGAQVYFFNPLAHSLDDDRPVYALQPGVYEDGKLHGTIEEMAQDYTNEIRLVQPAGPYNILVYCFSTAVGIEIAAILKKNNQKTNMIVVDSLIDQQDFSTPDRIKLRVLGFAKRIAKNPLKAIELGYKNHLPEFIKGKRLRYFGNEEEKKLESIKRNLIDIYNAYEWKQKFLGSMSLLLTEKSDKKLNDMYLENWNKMTDNQVRVIPLEGQHHELFVEPKVNLMGRKIEKELL